MGMLDFLKVTVVEKVAVAKYTAHLLIDGKQLSVANLGVNSVTVSGKAKLAVGQKVSFDLALKDPKDNLRLKGSGTVASVGKDTAKINFDNLPDATKQTVARFLARYMINR